MSDSDENITPVVTPIKNPENRGLAAAIADLLVEARQHTIGLRTLYVDLCKMEGVVPRLWGLQLLSEQERHAERVAQQVNSLRTVIA